MIEANSRFLLNQTKKYSLAVLWRFFVPRIKLGSYFSYQECSVHVRTYAFAYSWNLEKYIDFSNFLRAFLLLIRDKYLAFYCCFCVRISFILLLIRWSEMDPNVKPQTLVETFDQANSNSIRTICSSHNFVDLLPVSTCTALDCKLLYEGPWQTRDWALLQFYIWAQGSNWYWWHYNRVCLSEGYTFRPLLVTSLMASLFYSFLP